MNGARRFDLLIFDWDGTLCDSAAPLVAGMQQAIRALSLPPREDTSLRELIGLGFRDGMRRLYPELDTEHVLALITDYRRRSLPHGSVEAPLFAGVAEALRTLHAQGFRLAIATGKPRSGLNRSLRHHDELARLLSSSRCADETACKPDPLMLRELLQQENLGAEQALLIGDTEYDAAMACALGMPMLGVTCGVHEGGRILAAGAVGLIEQVGDLSGWLANH